MFELPKLPYEYNALEPHIDEQTMTIHHTKHHQAYVDNANKALAGTPFADSSVEEVLKHLDAVPEAVRMAARNNAGGHYNHSLFWQMMGPGKGGSPSGELGVAIDNKFGDFGKFSEQFKASALGRFGSGWGWLVSNDEELELTTTPNQDTPFSEGKTPLLGVDMWEHSFYLKHQSNKKAYLEDFFHVINWDLVEERYQKSL